MARSADERRVTVYVYRFHNAVILEGLTQYFIVTKAALVITKIKSGYYMLCIINSAV